MKTKLLVTVIVIIVIAIGAWLFFRSPHSAIAPSESASPSPTASVSPNGNITISLPKAGETVESPILVTGTARVFENQFTVQVKDSFGKVVASAHVMSDAKDVGQFGNYSVRIPIPAGTATDNMTVEALSYSPKGDNSYEGYAFAPVKLKQTDTMNVYAAFLTDSNDCTKTTLFPRSITKTSQSPLMSLMELLKGPNDAEKSNGHAVSEIPDGVEINSLRQSGSTIYVDFNQALQQGVAGSCRVQSIRAEITDTLKQFLGVTNVVISINGKTTGILQP